MRKSSIIFVILFFGCTSPLPFDTTSTIGYIGCSNTKQIVYGYHGVGGTLLWNTGEERLHDYDGGAVLDWAESDNNKFWERFDRYLEHFPNTEIIWWQLCIRKDEASMVYEDARPIIETLRQKIPGVLIYVSPLSEYTENVCEITGVEGINRAYVLAKELDQRNEDVFSGPTLGPMTPDIITTQENDRCHLNEQGMKLLGQQLKDFFERKTIQEVPEEFPMNDSDVVKTEDQSNIKAVQEPTIDVRQCEPPPIREVSDLYYNGPLIDTHIHIASPPDGEIDEEQREPLLGYNVDIIDYVCMMEYENTSAVFAFFPVWEPIIDQQLEIVKTTIAQHPSRFIPFIMPPDDDSNPNGFPTVDAKTLEAMLTKEPGLFQGYGEIGLYARGDHSGPKGAPALFPDANRLQEIYPLIQEHNLLVYFHLGEGQQASYERVLSSYPSIIFIFHGDQLIKERGGKQDLGAIDAILTNHPNAYYGIDELYGDVWILKPEFTKDEFIAHFKEYEPLLQKDLETWKGFITRHPNQVLWGTDRGWSAPWSLDLDVARVLNNYSRTFIGRLPQEVQEQFAYKNAQLLVDYVS